MGFFLLGLVSSNYGIFKSSPNKKIFAYGYFIEMGSIFLSEIFNFYALILTVSIGTESKNNTFLYQGISIFIIISVILAIISFISMLHFKTFRDELLFQKLIRVKFRKVKAFGINGFIPLRFGDERILFIYGEKDRFIKKIFKH